MGDEDYSKFKEEEVNAKKMTTILRNLNSPKSKTGRKFFSHSKNNSSSFLDY